MKSLLGMAFLVVLWVTPSTAQNNIHPGKNVVIVRGQAQKLYFIPGAPIPAQPTHHRILFAPGDGGWHGFAITMAKQLAAQGNDVYAFDTKRYLSSFTHGKEHLTPAEVMGDFQQLAELLATPPLDKLTLVGWSTGAGLVVLAAAGQNKSVYDGLITISLGKTNILGWRCWDNLTYLTNKTPHEPTYQTESYLPQVTPLPIFVIQSSNDQFIPNEEAAALFIQSKHPKHFKLIHAHDHSFNGNRAEFFAALQNGLQWIKRRDRQAVIQPTPHAPAGIPKLL